VKNYSEVIFLDVWEFYKAIYIEQEVKVKYQSDKKKIFDYSQKIQSI
jgi:hypothetical protein